MTKNKQSTMDSHKRSRSNNSSIDSGSDSDNNKIHKSASSIHKKVRSVDARMLDINDEVFRISSGDYIDAILIIFKRVEPTIETYEQWNKCAISFYLKMCTCCGVEPCHFDNAKSKPLIAPPLPYQLQLNMGDLDSDQKIKEDEEKMLADSKATEEEEPNDYVMKTHKGPFTFGSYPPGKVTRIPYHLYLLVKDASDFIESDNMVELEIVEKKIDFFCTYFHSHLPTGWMYNRDNAKLDTKDYDTKRLPRYDMRGYTPSRELDKGFPDKRTHLKQHDLAAVMSIIHSKKTPDFSEMRLNMLVFYCKLCSCFGIKYDNLEAASDEDVCLMNMGKD